MLSESIRSLDEAARFAAEADLKLRTANLFGVHQDAEAARQYALAAKTETAIELAVRATMSDALAFAYADSRHPAGMQIRLAEELAAQGPVDRGLLIELELTRLHVLEMGRKLKPAQEGLWSVGHELAAAPADARPALRAFSRLMACAIWAGELDEADAARAEARRLEERIEDPDDLGSFQIWCAQLATLEHDFDAADAILERSLEMRAQTPRRAITDLYAGALLELERGRMTEGRELTDAFMRETERTGLRQYARVGAETLLPRIR